jgi:hypothetical protein
MNSQRLKLFPENHKYEDKKTLPEKAETSEKLVSEAEWIRRFDYAFLSDESIPPALLHPPFVG